MVRSFAACHVADQKSIIHTIALVHYLVWFHGMTTPILEIYCVAFREQRLHVHLAPAKMCIAESNLCDAMHFHCDVRSLCRSPLRCVSIVEKPW